MSCTDDRVVDEVRNAPVDAGAPLGEVEPGEPLDRLGDAPRGDLRREPAEAGPVRADPAAEQDEVLRDRSPAEYGA